MNDNITFIRTEFLVSFKDYPYKIDENDLDKLIESVEKHGILSPIKVKPFEDRYEIKSGHKRVKAAKALNIEVPAIIEELSDDDAIIQMVDSNIQRENLLPSERAFAYKKNLSYNYMFYSCCILNYSYCNVRLNKYCHYVNSTCIMFSVHTKVCPVVQKIVLPYKHSFIF